VNANAAPLPTNGRIPLAALFAGGKGQRKVEGNLLATKNILSASSSLRLFFGWKRGRRQKAEDGNPNPINECDSNGTLKD